MSNKIQEANERWLKTDVFEKKKEQAKRNLKINSRINSSRILNCNVNRSMTPCRG